MNNLISCNLMGGLGNQIFQAAHALAQGMKHNREVVFVPQSWTPMQGRQASNYVNNVFLSFFSLNSSNLACDFSLSAF